MLYGLQVEGRPVAFDVIRTNPDYLEDVQLSIERSVWTTVCRHAERSLQPKPGASSTAAALRLMGRRALGPFLRQRPDGPLLESQPVRIAEPAVPFPRFDEGDLFDMLRTDSAGQPNRYNFVLTGDRLITMKIIIKMKYVDWILSKHVLMAGYSEDVRFAGEFWKGEDSRLHFSSNSGTYQPGATLLDSMAALLARTFPNLPIQIERP